MNTTEILILVFSFVTLLALGVPVAYCLGMSGILTMLVSIETIPAATTFAQRMATGLDSFALLAIPFFILAGELMNRGGIAQRLIGFAKALVGMFPGGLAYVNILACMLFGAISGSAVAAASAIGGSMGPAMEKEGYSKPFGAAVNITSSTTGMLIPPSNILIIYSLASGGASIAALFLAGYLPGLLIGGLLMAVSGVWAYRKGFPTGKFPGIPALAARFVEAIPSLLLLIIVIGGIVAGIFTATEASAVAVLYTFVLAVLIYKEIAPKELFGVLLSTVKTTAVVMFLIGASMGMSWVMAFEDIPQSVSAGLLSISDNAIVIMLIINVLLLFVGIFMDMTPAVLIFTPIFLPVVEKLGVDPIHFGIIMITNLCIGLCTPPVGTVLFVGCGVANVKIQDVLKPLLPLFIVMIIGLLLITYVPAISLWLPKISGL